MKDKKQVPDVKEITVKFEDGSVKQIEKGCCVDLADVKDKMHIALLRVQPYDMVRLAYGLAVVVEKMGMTDKLMEFADRKEAEDESGI